MPFIMKKSSERLNSDITYDQKDPRTGDIVSKGNGLKPLVLTGCDHLNYRGEDTDFKDVVYRGQPDPIKMCWNGDNMPVFRVLTYKFEADSDWKRFMAQWKMETSGLKDQVIYYEPAMEDIREDEYDNKSFPLWVIEDLEAHGEFKRALTEAKVDLPDSKKLTQSQYDAIMKEIEIRKAKAKPKPEAKKLVGNVS